MPSESKLKELHCTTRIWNSISNMWRRRTSIGVVGEEKDRDTDGPLENASSAPLTWSFPAVMLTRLACED